MNVLITGASGFVGPVLAKALAEKFSGVKIWGTYYLHHEFHDIDQSLLIPYNLDLQNTNGIKAALNEIKPDRIIHLAAQSSVGISWKRPSLTFEINVVGTLNLLEAIREFNTEIPVLMIGSSEEYGLFEGNSASENDLCEPMNPYGISKLTQEKIAQLYVNSYSMKLTMTRSFNHIGPGQNESFVISDWCRQVALIEKGKQHPTISVGNLDVERDFSHVDDVCKAYLDILDKGTSGEVYNVGSGIAIPLSSILDKIILLSEKTIEIYKDPDKMRPSENTVICCDRKKLNTISNHSFRPIEEALEDVLNYWRNKV